MTACSDTLAAGQSCTTEVTFSPTTTGSFNGTLTFTSALANSPHQVTLAGTAFNPVSLAAATLPEATVGQTYSFDFKPLLSVTGDPSYSGPSQAQFLVGSGLLPAGLSLSNSGVLTGTPTAPVSGQIFSVVAEYRGNQSAQSYSLNIAPNYYDVTSTISSNVSGYNMRSVASAAGWDGVRPLRMTVTINSGVYVGSTSTASHAFTTGSGFPAGSILRVINNGNIVGMGGAGGNAHAAGQPGGPALQVQAPLIITNNGMIAGGGGGGSQTNTHSNVAAGGGGGGAGLWLGGRGHSCSELVWRSISPGNQRRHWYFNRARCRGFWCWLRLLP